MRREYVNWLSLALFHILAYENIRGFWRCNSVGGNLPDRGKALVAISRTSENRQTCERNHFLFVCLRQLSLSSSNCHKAHCVDQAGQELGTFPLPLPPQCGIKGACHHT